MNIRRWLGIGGVDLVIQTALTLCAIGVFVNIVGPRAQEIATFGVLGISVLVLAVRRHFALRRQGGDETTGELAGQHLAELEMRLSDLELGQGRITELEDRLDFAERLLAQRQDQMLPGPPA